MGEKRSRREHPLTWSPTNEISSLWAQRQHARKDGVHDNGRSQPNAACPQYSLDDSTKLSCCRGAAALLSIRNRRYGMWKGPCRGPPTDDVRGSWHETSHQQRSAFAISGAVHLAPVSVLCYTSCHPTTVNCLTDLPRNGAESTREDEGRIA